MPTTALREAYLRLVVCVSAIAGNPSTFVAALAVVVLWLLVGPFLHFSSMWESHISTVTSVITFLLIFVLQNSQNREIRAFQLKLDEIIRATEGAQNSMVSLEKLTDEELETLSAQYRHLAESARSRIQPKATPKE